MYKCGTDWEERAGGGKGELPEGVVPEKSWERNTGRIGGKRSSREGEGKE